MPEPHHTVVIVDNDESMREAMHRMLTLAECGYLDNLDNEPIAFQVPDFGARSCVYSLYDARTEARSSVSSGQTNRRR